MGTDYLLVASNKTKVLQRQLVICLKEYTMWCYVQGDFDIEYDNDAELLLAEWNLMMMRLPVDKIR